GRTRPTANRTVRPPHWPASFKGPLATTPHDSKATARASPSGPARGVTDAERASFESHSIIIRPSLRQPVTGTARIAAASRDDRLRTLKYGQRVGKSESRLGASARDSNPAGTCFSLPFTIIAEPVSTCRHLGDIRSTALSMCRRRSGGARRRVWAHSP